MDKLEILYINEDEVLVNPHRCPPVTKFFPRSDKSVTAIHSLVKRIDSRSTLVSVSVEANLDYLYGGCKKLDAEMVAFEETATNEVVGTVEVDLDEMRHSRRHIKSDLNSSARSGRARHAA